MYGPTARIAPSETEIIGRHILRDGRVVADDQCQRVQDLVGGYLEFLGKDASGWDALYRDPADGRFWERVYLESAIHGGGPASLRVVEARRLRDVYARQGDLSSP